MIKLASIMLFIACASLPVVSQTTLAPEVFRDKLKSEKGILIDVRTVPEFKAERIAGSINMDVNDSSFVSEIKKLEPQKNYFIYCGKGKRSARAAGIMNKEGFLHVYDLEKGLEEWKAHGLPTIKEAHKGQK